MTSDSQISPSDAIFLNLVAAIGIVLYAGFAYVVTHSRNIEVNRRWRYSILWGVSYGTFLSILFGIVSVLALFSDADTLGYMAVFRSLRSPLDLFTGIILFLVYPVLISLPFVFLVTFGTYWQELQSGDLLINRLVYPIKKHPSDQSPDSVFEQVRTLIAKLID